MRPGQQQQSENERRKYGRGSDPGAIGLQAFGMRWAIVPATARRCNRAAGRREKVAMRRSDG
jgi:hypothetical protein